MTKIIPKYIYQNFIINSIITYILNNSKLKSYYYIESYIFKSINNELIELSLVSKEWFKYVSRILEEQLNFKNFKILKPLLENPNSDKTNNFKLIKFNQSSSLSSSPIASGILVFNSLNEYFRYTFLINSIKIYKFILIRIPTHKDSIEVLKSFKSFPSNITFNLSIELDQIESIDFFNKISIYNDIDSNIKRINKINLAGFYNNNNELIIKLILNKLKPKSISYFPNTTYSSKNHINYSIFFKDKNLESFKINNSDHVEPIDFENLSINNSNLKSITIPISFHRIIKKIHNNNNNNNNNNENIQLYHDDDDNNDEEIDHNNKINECIDHFTGFKNNGLSIEQDWKLMCKKLSNYSNLKKLSLFNCCSDTYYCIDDNLLIEYQESIKIINQGLSLILNNNKSIEILTLEGYGFIDSTFLLSLSLNTSIKTLRLLNCHEKLIFNQLFSNSNNKHNIRNLIIESIILSNDCLEYFSNNNLFENLDLYSISFMNEDLDSLNQSLKILKNLSNIKEINIKEINFYLIDQISLSSLSDSSIKERSIINNIIINIYLKNNNQFLIGDLSDDNDSDGDNYNIDGFNNSNFNSNGYYVGYNDD